MSSLPIPNVSDITHSEARTKVGQRVVTLKESKGHKPIICIGHVVAVELSFIYNGADTEEPMEPTLLVEWDGVPEFDSLSWKEYQQNLQEI